MIINAENLIIGRIATFASKQALLGEKVEIVNSEKAVVSGTKLAVVKRYKKYFDRGTPSKGPFIPKSPERLLKRIIRGMLPYKQPKGKLAFNRIKCYVGVPENFKDQKVETFEYLNKNKLPNTNFVTIKEISVHLGGKK